MKLFIHQGFAINTTHLTPTFQRVKKVLDKAKTGELFTTVQLARLLKAHTSTFSEGPHDLPTYTHKVKNIRYWAKPATIKQLIKETR